MTILVRQGSTHLGRLMALLLKDEERGGGLVQKEEMDNCVYPDRGTQATTVQKRSKFFIPFLNKIEQTGIAQGIDYEGKTATWQRHF